MKSKIILILVIFFSTSNALFLIGQKNDRRQDGALGMNYEFNISEPFSNELPPDLYHQGMRRANEWGGGEDAPDPEAPPTGGDVPIGDGILIMICFTIIFLFVKRRMSTSSLNSKMDD